MINIENKKDNECFKWCHLAFLFPLKTIRSGFQNINNL